MSVSGGGGGGSGGAIRAARAFVEVYWEDNALRRGLASAQKRWAAFGAMIGGAGRTLAGAGIGAGVALAGVFKSAVSRSSEFARLSEKLADSTENLSAFAYAAQTTGMSLDDLVDNFENWPERLTAASQGTGEAAEAFKRLGLDAGNLMKLPITEQMIALAGAMGQVGNNSERLAILGNLFSDKGQWFNSLFAKGPEGIRKLMAEAGKVGAVVTTEQAAAAGRIDAALSKSWIAAKSGFLSIGDALLPTEDAINRSVDGIVSASQQVRGWISANQDLVIGAGLLFAGMTAVGLALSLLGPAITAASAAWGVFSAIVSAGMAVLGMIKAVFLSPILLIPAAIAAAVAAFFTLTSQGQQLLSQLGNSILDAFGPTFENAKAAYGTVVDAIRRGDFESAIAVAVAFANVEWVRFTNFLESTLDAALENVNSSWESFAKNVESFVQGMIDSVSEMLDYLANPDKIEGINRLQPNVAVDDGGFAGLIMKNGESAQQRRFRLAQEALDQAIADSRAKANQTKKDDAAKNSKASDGPLEEKLNQLQNQIRGTFAGSASVGFFQQGYTGLEKVARDQLKKQDQQLAALGRIEGAVRGIDGVRFGESN